MPLSRRRPAQLAYLQRVVISGSQTVIDGHGDLPLRAEGVLDRLDTEVAEQELDLLQVAVGVAAELRTGTPHLLRPATLDPNLPGAVCQADDAVFDPDRNGTVRFRPPPSRRSAILHRFSHNWRFYLQRGQFPPPKGAVDQPGEDHVAAIAQLRTPSRSTSVGEICPARARYPARMTTAELAFDPPQHFSPYVRQLLQEALPSLEELPTVSRLMAEAKAKGMTSTEALEYVLERWSAGVKLQGITT